MENRSCKDCVNMRAIIPLSKLELRFKDAWAFCRENVINSKFSIGNYPAGHDFVVWQAVAPSCDKFVRLED
jgi:hypothetical protein